MKTYIVKVNEWGTKYWYLNGQLPRTDGPAVECAVEFANGTKRWYLNDRLHRTDGPAVEYADGTKYWYLNGAEFTETEWRKQTQKVKAPCAGKVVEVDGVKYRLTAI
jgi:hypothetical protein